MHRILYAILIGICLPTLMQGCKQRRGSDVKNVNYVDNTLSKRFAYSEICDPDWRTAVDTKCSIQQLDTNGSLIKRLSSEVVYKGIGLVVPVGEAGEKQMQEKQKVIDQISDATAKSKAEEILATFKDQIDRKENLKATLANGDGTGDLSCFTGNSAIGVSGVTCDQLEKAFNSGATGNNVPVGGTPSNGLTCQIKCQCERYEMCDGNVTTEKCSDNTSYAYRDGMNFKKKYATEAEASNSLSQVCKGNLDPGRSFATSSPGSIQGVPCGTYHYRYDLTAKGATYTCTPNAASSNSN